MISGSMMSSIKSIEDKLAKEEINELERIANSFPDGHPLKEQYNDLSTSIGSTDLSLLPTTHPFISVLKDVKRSLDEGNRTEEDIEKDRKDGRKKAIDDRNQRIARQREEREAEDGRRQVRKNVASNINSRIDRVSKELADLVSAIKASENDVSDDSHARVKLAKIQRVATSFNRGLNDCRISQTRSI